MSSAGQSWTGSVRRIVVAVVAGCVMTCAMTYTATALSTTAIAGPADDPPADDSAGDGSPDGAPAESFTPVLSVSLVTDLDPVSQTVTVAGSGYDEARGIYVAFCVVPPPGQPPTPCGGGVDMTGESGSSHWISSHPPDYGDGLAVPYGAGGSFEVELSVSAMLSADIDCRVVQCAVVTRNDHTRLADRGQDVIVPVWFGEPRDHAQSPDAASPDPTPSPSADPGTDADQAPDTSPSTPDTSSTLGTTPTPPPIAATTTTPTVTSAPSDDVVEPPRGAAPVWPVWTGTGVAALGLVVVRRPWRSSRRGGGA